MPTHITTCDQCGIKFAVPMSSQNEIELLYERGGYWKKYTEDIFTPTKAPGQFIQSAIRWRFILQYSGDCLFDILDIGAGYGFLGQTAFRKTRERLQSYAVVEKDEYFLNSLRWTWNQKFSDIKFSAYSDLTNVEGKFNLIVLSHILEHLSNPFEYLKLIHNLLVRNGNLYIEVPFLDNQFKNDMFPHLIFFDIDSLRDLCERAGYKVVTVQSFGKRKDISPKHYRNEKRIDVRLYNLLKSVLKQRSNSRKAIDNASQGRKKNNIRFCNLTSVIAKNKYLRLLTHSSISGHIISFYFGYKRSHPDGTWIRLVASKCGSKS